MFKPGPRRPRRLAPAQPHAPECRHARRTAFRNRRNRSMPPPRFIVSVVINNAPPLPGPALHAARLLHKTLRNRSLTMHQDCKPHPAQGLILAAANRRFRVVCTGSRLGKPLFLGAPGLSRPIFVCLTDLRLSARPGQARPSITMREAWRGDLVSPASRSTTRTPAQANPLLTAESNRIRPNPARLVGREVGAGQALDPPAGRPKGLRRPYLRASLFELPPAKAQRTPSWMLCGLGGLARETPSLSLLPGRC